MREIIKTIIELAKERPIFHSEADFQHALAWKIQKELPKASIRIEFPIRKNKLNKHIDIKVINKNENVYIELKYKTQILEVKQKNEKFILKNQSAKDIGRYDFLKDIQRLEEIIEKREKCIGYAILLTNENAYWEKQHRQNTYDADFKIYENRALTGKLKWNEKTSEGTKRNREQSIELRNNYIIKWHDYSKPSTSINGTFRFVVIKVLNNEG